MIHLLINGTDKIRQHRLKPITADETSEQEPDIFLRMLIIIGNFLRLIVFSNCFKRKAPHRDKMIIEEGARTIGMFIPHGPVVLTLDMLFIYSPRHCYK